MPFEMRAAWILTSTTMLVAACDPGARPRSEALARVEQTTIEEGTADTVFGQLDLNRAEEPPFLSTDKVRRPVGIGTDALGRRENPPGLYWIADRGAHRVIGVYVGQRYGTHLVGQFSWSAQGLPNRGGTVAQGSLDTPTAVAFTTTTATSPAIGWLAIADSGNHRVVLGRTTGASIPQLTVVIGQHGDFYRANPNDGGFVAADTLSSPRGVAFDDQKRNPGATSDSELGRLHVVDSGNHRILVYRAGLDSTIATMCLGQADCEHGAPNRGAAAPSAETLSAPTGIATSNPVGDDNRGFYVADTGNHRVLYFPARTGGAPSPTAARVYGQLDFKTAIPSNGGVTAASLNAPTAVAVAADGSLWVADTGHHRVLHFPKGNTVADRVLGQPDFNTADAPTAASATTLNEPSGLALTPDGSLIVGDTLHARVLRYRVPCKVEDCNDNNPCTDETCDPELGCVSRTATWPKACAPYRCDFMTKRCFDACQAMAGWCQSPYQCIDTRCAVTCSELTTCPMGLTCADGFCCDAPCKGTCESCNQPKQYGRCLAAPIGPPPFPRQCAIEVEGECGTSCDGAERKQCVFQPSGKACGHEACTTDDDGARATLRGTCNGSGTCVSGSASCAPYACGGGGCRVDCSMVEHCSEGAHCVSGVCTLEPARIRGGGCGLAVSPPTSTPGSFACTLATAMGVALALFRRHSRSHSRSRSRSRSRRRTRR